MSYVKNKRFYLNEYKKIDLFLKKNGVAVVKNFIKKNDIDDVKKKAQYLLNCPKYLGPANNLSKIIKKNSVDALKNVIINLKTFLKFKDLSKGYKFYSKLTNSIEIINPLINFPVINKYIFDNSLIKIAQHYLKKKNIKILYVAFRCHFKNNLPIADFNYFHTDDRKFITKKNNSFLKLLIPFHLNKNSKIEFRQFTIHKNRMKLTQDQFNKLQYLKAEDYPNRFKKYLVRPNVKNTDAYFFDPDNFFHNAEKPKSLRIMLYVVFGSDTSYLAKKTKKIKILKSFFNSLTKDQKNLGKLLTKVESFQQ